MTYGKCAKKCEIGSKKAFFQRHIEVLQQVLAWKKRSKDRRISLSELSRKCSTPYRALVDAVSGPKSSKKRRLPMQYRTRLPYIFIENPVLPSFVRFRVGFDVVFASFSVSWLGFHLGFFLLSLQPFKVNDPTRIGGQNQGELPHPPVTEAVCQGAERQSCDGVPIRCFKRRSQSNSTSPYQPGSYSSPGLPQSFMADDQSEWKPEVENLRFSNCFVPCTCSTTSHQGINANCAARFACYGTPRSRPSTHTYTGSPGIGGEARVRSRAPQHQSQDNRIQ